MLVHFRRYRSFQKPGQHQLAPLLHCKIVFVYLFAIQTFLSFCSQLMLFDIKMCLTAPDSRYFHITADGRGLFFVPPPQNSGTKSLIYKIQTAFDRSGKFVQRNLMLLTSVSPMTSQVRSISKCLTIWRDSDFVVHYGRINWK